MKSSARDTIAHFQKLLFSKQIGRVKAIFLYSTIIVFYGNFVAIKRFVVENFHTYKTFFALQYSLSGIIIIIGLTSTILFVFSFNRKLMKGLALFFAFVSGLYSYFIYKFDIYMNSRIFDSAVGANPDEVWSVIDFLFIPYVLIFSVIPCILIFKFQLKKEPKQGGRKVNFYKKLFYIYRYVAVLGAMAIIALLVCYRSFQTKYFDNIRLQAFPVFFFYPSQTLLNGYGHFNCMVNGICSERERLRDYPKNFVYNKKNQNEPLIAIFVVGESLRSDRLSVNGYTRKTTPWMDEAVKTRNLAVFNDVRACDNYTMVSMPCMLSATTIKEWHSEDRKLMKALFSPITHMGWDTYFYAIQRLPIIDNYIKQFADTKHYETNSDLAVQDNISGFYMDKYVIPHLKTDVKENTLYVIHHRGNHKPYNMEYDVKNPAEAPFGTASESDLYDNSTLAFDGFMRDLTERFKNKNAFIFYISDHGDSFGEMNPKTGKRAYFHGLLMPDKAPDEQMNVPLIIWGSDKFISANQKLFNHMKALAKSRDVLELTHDTIFHSFLDCLDISSPMIDKEMSLCSGFKQFA